MSDLSDRIVIVIGHSHVSALSNYLKLALDAGLNAYCFSAFSKPGFLNFAAIDAGERIFNRDVLTEIDAAVPPSRQGLYVSMFGGNAHNAIGMLEAKPDFDFYMLGQPSVEKEDVVDISLGMIRHRLRIEAVAALEHIALLKGLRRGPVIHLCSPPPIADNYFIAENLGRAFIETHGVSAIARPALRLKLWLLHTEIVRTHCEAVGVVFVPCPLEAVTDGGFLRAEYWKDAAHANADYGRLQAAQIRNVLTRLD